jgi:hypothetical protein
MLTTLYYVDKVLAVFAAIAVFHMYNQMSKYLAYRNGKIKFEIYIANCIYVPLGRLIWENFQ